MSDTWIEENCPKCDALNWICLGDMQDETGVDVEGYKCHKCGDISIFDEGMLRMEHNHLPIEKILEKYSVFIEDGLEKPD